MNDNEVLDIILEKDEWQTFECKRALVKPSKLLETIVAFANTNGGIIIIGLEDQEKAVGRNRLIGISEGPNNVSDALKLLGKDIVPPLPKVTTQELPIKNVRGYDDKIIIIFVEKSNDVHSVAGDTFVRKGSQNTKIGAQEIQRLQYEKGLRRFEDEISSVNDLAELNSELLKQYAVETESATSDMWQFLKDNGLAIKRDSNYFMTKAGVLLFGNNPTVLLKNKCGIKVSHYFGIQPNYSGEPNFVAKPFSIEGPLIKQIEEMVKYFRTAIKNSPPKLKGASFSPSLLIPEWAFQESITNAVVHRNYSVEDDIQVRFFDNRIEIESPGTYPGHITTNNIRQERFSRNPIIQRTLNRFKNSPNLDIGEGVDRMFQIMKENNLYEPLFIPSEDRPNSVLLKLLNLQRIEYWDTMSNFLDKHYVITNQKAREITSVSDSVEMSRLLKGWVSRGLLQKFGRSKKSLI